MLFSVWIKLSLYCFPNDIINITYIQFFLLCSCLSLVTRDFQQHWKGSRCEFCIAALLYTTTVLVLFFSFACIHMGFSLSERGKPCCRKCLKGGVTFYAQSRWKHLVAIKEMYGRRAYLVYISLIGLCEIPYLSVVYTIIF